jgi:hypothetical protein
MREIKCNSQRIWIHHSHMQVAWHSPSVRGDDKDAKFKWQLNGFIVREGLSLRKLTRSDEKSKSKANWVVGVTSASTCRAVPD